MICNVPNGAINNGVYEVSNMQRRCQKFLAQCATSAKKNTILDAEKAVLECVAKDNVK